MNSVFSSTCPYLANHCCSNGKRRTSLGHPIHKCCWVCSAWQKAQLPSTLSLCVQHVWLWPWPHGPPTTEDPRCVSPSEVCTRISSYLWENLLQKSLYQKYHLDSGTQRTFILKAYKLFFDPLGKTIIFGALKDKSLLLNLRQHCEDSETFQNTTFCALNILLCL